MKKKKNLAAALAAVLILAGCSNGNKPAETTTAAPATATTTAAPETTTTEAATAAPETTTEAQTVDNSGKKTIYSTFDGQEFYREDCEVNEWKQLSVPYAYARLSTGMYFDSEKNPDLFTPDEFSYTGERAQTGSLVRLEKGSQVGSLTVSSASTMIAAPWDEAVGDINPEADSGFELATEDVAFTGDITLTGMARLYYDEFYTVASGDIVFVPDNCYAGLPLMIDLSTADQNNGTLNFDEKGGTEENGGYWDPTYGGGLCVYSDAPIFRLGNLTENYSDRPEIFEFFDGGNANCTKKVEITLTDVTLGWNNNFGASFACMAKIKDIKAIN